MIKGCENMNYYHWIIPILLILILSGYYFGKKIRILFSKVNPYIYWIVIYLFTSISILMRTIFAGFLLYYALFSLIYDLAYFITLQFKSKKYSNFLNRLYHKGITVIIICLMISIYGYYNLHHPIIKEYQVTLENLKKPTSIGLITDLHLGIIKEKDYLPHLVKEVNSLNLDTLVLAGDIFDEYTTNTEKELFYHSLDNIKTKYGIYYTEGNHDLLNDETRKNYSNHHVTILEDQVVLINQNYNLIGRLDYRNKDRKSIISLIKETNPNYPVVLVDHQPKDMNYNYPMLQLSGHTHKGQVYPGNFFLPYGYYNYNGHQTIISAGYGAWAFPIRTSGHGELIKVTLQ